MTRRKDDERRPNSARERLREELDRGLTFLPHHAAYLTLVLDALDAKLADDPNNPSWERRYKTLLAATPQGPSYCGCGQRAGGQHFCAKHAPSSQGPTPAFTRDEVRRIALIADLLPEHDDFLMSVADRIERSIGEPR